MAEWNISRPEGTCCVSGRALEEGEEIYCVLLDTPEGLVRRDCAAEHWTGPPDEAFCSWKSRIPQRAQKKRTFVDDEILLSFFTRLAEETDPRKVSFRFVLALILMRKRLLKYERTEWEEQREIWVMRLGKETDEHRIRNPHLGDEQIREVSEQLGLILHSDLGDFDGMEDDATEPEPADNVQPESSEPDGESSVGIESADA